MLLLQIEVGIVKGFFFGGGAGKDREPVVLGARLRVKNMLCHSRTGADRPKSSENGLKGAPALSHRAALAAAKQFTQELPDPS